MGVKGLWELLAPSGRQVKVEMLGGTKVAVDASIWLIQFVKAMRRDDGEMQQNAHLLGMFRRLCKLLFLKVRPVIVFDGAPPVLKRRTLQNRKKLRQKGQTNLTKIAEKLLQNQLRAFALSQHVADKEATASSGLEFSNPNAPTEQPAPLGAQQEGGAGAAQAAGKDAAEKEDEMEEVPTGDAADEALQLQLRAFLDSDEERGGDAGSAESEKEEWADDAGDLGERLAVRLPAGVDYTEVKEQVSALPKLQQYYTLQQLKEDQVRATRPAAHVSAAHAARVSVMRSVRLAFRGQRGPVADLTPRPPPPPLVLSGHAASLTLY
jgi:hypothetical protein